MILTVALTGFSGGVMNFFPNYGLNIYPVGNFLIPIAVVLMAYYILKYQLFDIQIIIKRSIVYYLLVLAISGAYILIVVFLEKALQGLIKYRPSSSTIAAFTIGILFFPLRNKIKRVVDKFFFVKSHEEIEHENALLKSHLAKTEKTKSIALLASGVAHEIKNPLTPIKTFLEYLPQKSDDKAFIEKFSKLAHESVERIDELVNELLKFSKPAPLNLTSVNLNRVLDSTLGLLNSELLRHNIETIKDFTDTLQITADQNQIRQAFLNIFLNAIDAMPNGGTLTVKTYATEKGCQISIQDTGPGIPKQDLPHIFDPFFSKKDKGTGLGLSITQGIIIEHGGKIRAESNPGKGATFIITLPIDRTI